MFSYLLTGTPLPSGEFTGKEEAGFASTFLLIFNIAVDCFALEVTVMLLFIIPTLLVLYFTTISAESPGKTGCFGHAGTVQPQLDLTL